MREWRLTAHQYDTKHQHWCRHFTIDTIIGAGARVSRSRSLTMCHKNWLFIKFYGCLLFDRWRIWLKCCIDARRLRAETKMCAIFFAIDRFPINIMLSFKRIMSSVWHCSHSLLSLLRFDGWCLAFTIIVVVMFRLLSRRACNLFWIIICHLMDIRADDAWKPMEFTSFQITAPKIWMILFSRTNRLKNWLSFIYFFSKFN